MSDSSLRHPRRHPDPDVQAWRARFPNISHRITFGNAVSLWLRSQAKRKKITVAELVRRIVMEKSGHF